MSRSIRSNRSDKFIALVAVLGFVCAASDAMALDHPVNWSLGVVQAPIAATVGDTLTFNFASGHNVEEFPDATAFAGCDFGSATFISGTGPVVVPLASPGTFYFGCGVGSHCASGNMSLEVNVNPAPAVPSLDPLVLTVVLGWVGGACAWREARRRRCY